MKSKARRNHTHHEYREPGNLQLTSMVSPGVTVIVCTRDRPELLEQCLCALSRQTHPHFDILVIDNAPIRAVQDICRRWGATWVLAPIAGLTRARNVGARLARGELIAYIDDDAVPEADWLEVLLEDFKDPEIGAVTGRVHYMKAQGDSRAISEEEAGDEATRARRIFDRNTARWFALACFGGIGDGGNMAFRRKLIASEQPFDERLGRGRMLDSGNEHVLFASLIARGHRIAHNPLASVRHPSPSTPELQRVRRISDLRSSISHLLFVWDEFPKHRIDLLRFLSRAVLKRIIALVARRRMRVHLPSTQALRAMLSGALIYWRTSREWGSVPKTVQRPPISARPENTTSGAAGR